MNYNTIRQKKYPRKEQNVGKSHMCLGTESKDKILCLQCSFTLLFSLKFQILTEFSGEVINDLKTQLKKQILVLIWVTILIQDFF